MSWLLNTSPCTCGLRKNITSFSQSSQISVDKKAQLFGALFHTWLYCFTPKYCISSHYRKKISTYHKCNQSAKTCFSPTFDFCTGVMRLRNERLSHIKSKWLPPKHCSIQLDSEVLFIVIDCSTGKSGCGLSQKRFPEKIWRDSHFYYLLVMYISLITPN